MFFSLRVNIVPDPLPYRLWKDSIGEIQVSCLLSLHSVLWEVAREKKSWALCLQETCAPVREMGYVEEDCDTSIMQ